MNENSVELKTVSKFYLVQADRQENLEGAVIDEKEFTDYKEAFRMVQKSEAPIRYLRFICGSDEYKMYPIEDSDEYDVRKTPVYN